MSTPSDRVSRGHRTKERGPTPDVSASPATGRPEGRRSPTDRVYGAMLRLYPAEFRDEYAEPMVQLFRDRRRDIAGARAFVGLWLEILLDLVRSAAVEHVDRFTRDLRFGLRSLGANPGFTAVVLLTLALGIGATSGVGSVAYAVLVRPLPFEDADRLFMVWMSDVRDPTKTDSTSPANFLDWRARNDVFQDMAALIADSYSLTDDGEPERVNGFRVSSSFFPLLGVDAVLGRTFLPEEDMPGRGRVVVVSHGLWQRRWGGARSVLGGSVDLNGSAHTVIGVMPPGFAFPSGADLWVPTAFTPAELAARGDRYLRVLGRLRREIGAGRAQAQMSVLAGALALEHPATNENLGITLVPLHEQIVGDARRSILVLLGAVAILLLIACTNVGTLLLSRASRRRGEFAIRVTLGARRGRLVRQVATESALLGLGGGLLGLVVAYGTALLVQPHLPPDLPRAHGIDLPILVTTLFVIGLTTLAFGAIPALRASDPDLAAAVRSDVRWSAERRSLGRKALVVAEVALALVLLIGAGLMLRSLVRLWNVDPGFQAANVMTARFELPDSGYADLARRRNFQTELVERVASLPGVESAAVTTFAPMTFSGGSTPYRIEGQPEAAPGDRPVAAFRVVSPGYFRTMGISLASGRSFQPTDTTSSRPVAVVNERAAERIAGGGDAVGRRIATSSKGPWLDVIGVVRNVRQFELDAEASPEIYVTHLQAGESFFTVPFFQPHDLVVRTSVDPLTLAGAIRRELRAVDSGVPLSRVRAMEEVVAGSVESRELQSLLIAAFAATALIMAAVGVYGAVSYLVAQRTREIGVRVVLGARDADVRRMLVREGLGLVALGLGIGLPASVGVGQAVSGLLYETATTDPATYIGVSVLLVLVGLVASYVPARRATRIEPMVILRAE